MVDDRWLSVEEIAAHRGVKRDTVYKWVDRKGLPADKVGRFWKFRKPEADAWVPPRSGAGDHSDHGSPGAVTRRAGLHRVGDDNDTPDDL